MNTIVVWLKRIFTIQTIGLMVAIGSLLVAIHQVWVDSDGEPVVSWNGAELPQNATTRTYVYTATTEQIPIAPLLVTIDNTTQFTAHDVSTKYQATTQGVNLTYSFDYKTQAGLQGIELRNADTTLPAFEQMSAPINYAELMGASGQINLSLRLTYNGIETPMLVNQQIFLKRFPAYLLQANAVTDARISATSDAALYIYDPLTGFRPLDLSVIPSENTTTPNARPAQPAKPTQPAVTPQKQQEQPQVVTPTSPKQETAVQSKPAKKKGGTHWTLIVGEILLVIAGGGMIAFLYMPIGAAYSKLGDQIFDGGFRIDFDALKWAFNNEFDDIFGDMHLPNWLSSILYALCVLAGAIATLLWISLFILILLGIIALIIKLF
ncbi:MAG: hypothetical protein IKY68_04500 [Alistipes sp.]|nr:hypothetical protein [Alistipes sp.]